jgi:hypothetical protein
MSAIFITSVVAQAKSSGCRSMPMRDPTSPGNWRQFPTSPAAASKPMESRISVGLKARRDGIRRCSMAWR